RVVQVTPGRGLGKQQVVADHGGQHVHVLRGQPDAGADVADHHLAGRGVVAGPALADVVQQGGDQEEVGTGDLTGVAGGVGGRLDQVAVDGETVDGVALRTVPHALPVRK